MMIAIHDTNGAILDYFNDLGSPTLIYKMWKHANFSDMKIDRLTIDRSDLIQSNMKHTMLTNLSGRSSNLSDSNFFKARLSGQFYDCNLSRITARHCDFTGSIFINCVLTMADFDRVNMRGVTFRDCDLTNALFKQSDLRGAKFHNCKMQGTDFSGAIMDNNPLQLLEENFEMTESGIIGYKIFGLYFAPPATWRIQQGSIITENVNPDRTASCGYGINIYSKKRWESAILTSKEVNVQSWKLLVRWEWAPSIVVPYNNIGVFRAGKAELIEINN